METDPLRPRARFIEAVLLFVVAPTVLAMFMQGWMVFPAIWTLAAVCLVVLMRDRAFDRAQLWNSSGLRRGLGIVIICFAVGAPVLGAGLLAYDPDRLFELPRRDLRLWGVIMVGYPVLSVYAQELAFRAFFFHRYAPLFRDTTRGRWGLIIASAAAFGYAHVIMHNAVASAAWGNATAENVTLLVVPMFHITGMVSVMHASIYVAATLVMMPRWDRDLAGRLISAW